MKRLLLILLLCLPFVFGLVPPAPAVTTTFTTSQVSAWTYGRFNDGVANSARYTFMASHSVAHFQITGTEAILKCGTFATNPFNISVDGGSYTNPAVSSGQITLFTGLSDAAHIVDIKLADFYNGSAWFTRPNCLDVTGASPAVAMDPNYGPYERVLGSSLAYSNMPTWAHGQTGYGYSSPRAARAFGGGGVVIRGKGERIYVFCFHNSSVRINLYIDGVLSTTTACPATTNQWEWVRLATGLDTSTEHEYFIQASSNSTMTDSSVNMAFDAVMFGGTGGAVSSTPVAAKRNVAFWGDSITQHAGCSSLGPAGGYVARTCAPLGVVPWNFGIAGETTAQVGARIASELAAVVAQVGDPALIVLNPGRNDVSGNGADPFKADYRAMVDLAVSGTTTSKIVCLVPWNLADNHGVSVKIAAVVSDVANPRVTLMYNSTSPAITTASGRSCDDLHPNDTGGQDMANWLVPLLQPYLGGKPLPPFLLQSLGANQIHRALHPETHYALAP